ncbi:hypothetical protein HDU97_001508 [Phlyctochytrium planicorne]|nr:hypothetical protein HDU97_001508 [Phlyctochytrium planicorne]
MQQERFVAKFVRRASRLPEKRKWILESLEAGQPFVEETTGALAMIDISGFSSLTSILAKKGKISSEVITQAVSSFMSRIIDVIHSHNGDVLKFLGDALLVIFESDGKNWKDMQQALRRCLVCCIDILLHCGSTKVDFSNYQHLTEAQEAERPSFDDSKGLTASNSLKRKANEKGQNGGKGKGGGNGSNQGHHQSGSQTGHDAKKKTNGSQFVLELHIAMSGGDLNHCVIGVPGERCDYFVYGSCLDQLGDALDLAKPGELSISQDGWGIMELSGKSGMGALRLRRNEDGHVTCDRGSLQDLRTIAYKEIQKRENFKLQVRRQTLTMMQASGAGYPVPFGSNMTGMPVAMDPIGVMSSTALPLTHEGMEIKEDIEMENWSAEILEFMCLFMNQSLVHKLQQTYGTAPALPPAGTGKAGVSSERRKSTGEAGATVSKQMFDDEILEEEGDIINEEKWNQRNPNPSSRAAKASGGNPGTNRKSFSGAAVESQSSRDDRDYMSNMETVRLGEQNKTRRVSLTAEMSSGNAEGLKGTEANRNILSEYRKVSVMFVKMAFEFDPEIAQKTFSLAFNALLPFDGVIQQYSVDDKGQSLLIVFGLPPWGHENNPLYALKASVSLSISLTKEGIGPFTISVSTGDLLFSILGNSIRSEAGLLGDVVNISARLMSLTPNSELSILCDNETKVATADIFNYFEFGRQVVKGKTEAIQVWGALNSKASRAADINSKGPTQIDKPIYGYSSEAVTFADSIKKWREKGEPNVIVIEAPTGMGKSTFLEEMIKEHSGTRFCVGYGNEIDKFTPFYCFHGVLKVIFQIFVTDLLPFFTETPVSQLRAKTNRSPSATSSGMVESALASQWSNAKKKKIHPRDSISVDMDYGDFADLFKFLTYFNENTDLAPLLHDAMPWIKIEENNVTSSLAGPARTTILVEMIVRIIAAMADKLELAIVFDNAQFLDNTSTDIMMALLKICPKILVVVSTRPLNQYKSKGIEAILKLYKSSLIKLNGLTLRETEEFLVWKFRDWGVTKIAPILTEAIQSRSSGSPLFIEQLADSIYFRSPPVVRCTHDGMLEPVSKGINLEEILVRNVETAVLVIFDRLNPIFQEFLRVASVFGQTFNLRHVVSVMETDITVDDMVECIKEFDSFQFLKTDGGANGSDPDKSFDYFFRHANFNTAIYESLPFSQRQEIHFKIASHYEAIMTEENRASILPNLTFHYMRTSTRDKNYYFMEQLATYYVQHKLFTEASISLERLIKFFESDSQANQDPTLTTNRQASWLSMLALCLLHLDRRSTESKLVALKALSLLGIGWPKKKEDFRPEIVRNARRLHINQILTLGGRIRRGKIKSREERMQLDVIFRALGVLRSLASVIPTTNYEEIPLMTLLYANYAFENSAHYLPELIKACVRLAQMFWFVGKKRTSAMFMSHMIRMLPLVNATINIDMMPAAHVLSYRGDFEASADFLKRCSKYAEMTGDRQIYAQAEFSQAQLMMLQGNFRTMFEISIRAMQICDVVNDVRMKHVFTGFLLVAHTFMDHEDVASFALDPATMEPSWYKVSNSILSLYKFRKGNVQESMDALLEVFIMLEGMPMNQITIVYFLCSFMLLPLIVISETQWLELPENKILMEKVCTHGVTAVARFTKCYIVAEAMLPIFVCASQLLKPAESSKALQTLESGRKKPHLRKVLENLKLLDLFYIATLGRFGTRLKNRELYRSLAVEECKRLEVKKEAM